MGERILQPVFCSVTGRSVSLHDNHLTGELDFNGLQPLEYAYLHNNRFTGPMPDLRTLPHLK
jgi:hypothetical protein